MDLGSPVCCLSLRPKSMKNYLASGPMGPRVSTANGMNVWHAAIDRYFVAFLSSASLAADPASVAVLRRCDGARVYGQVKSHTR